MRWPLADCGSVATWIFKPGKDGMEFRQRQPCLRLTTAPTPQAASALEAVAPDPLPEPTLMPPPTLFLEPAPAVVAPEPAPESQAMAPATPWYLKEQPPAQAATCLVVQAAAADDPAKPPTSIPPTRNVLSRWPTANSPASKTTAAVVKIPGNSSIADRAGAYHAACKRNPGKDASEQLCGA